jgi:hypothetical protein
MAGLQTQPELESVIKKYKKRLGIDVTTTIVVRIVNDSKKNAKRRTADAWIEQSPTHPAHYISVSKQYLRENRKFPRHITRTIVHELLHIVVADYFARLKPSYSYSKDRDALVEESMVIRLARAIVPLASDELYLKM